MEPSHFSLTNPKGLSYNEWLQNGEYKEEGMSANAEPNVVPLCDVLLVLLIIFMVLTPLLLREIAVTIPKKADDEVTADVAAQQIVLHLKKNKEINLDGQPVGFPCSLHDEYLPALPSR